MLLHTNLVPECDIKTSDNTGFRHKVDLKSLFLLSFVMNVLKY